MEVGEAGQGVAPGPVLRLAAGAGGLALCITLLSLGMRSVMDVGGMCAEGGPYEIAQTCPEGSVAATLLGLFGLFVFGGIALWGGSQVGGIWGSIPLLAWTGLFGVLGWNFLDYGIINPPEGETIVWGWLIPGVLFELMAFGPIVLGLWAMRAGGGPGARAGGSLIARPMEGPGQPGRLAGGPGSSAPAPSAALEVSEVGDTRQALQAIAEAMGAAVVVAAAGTPAAPDQRVAPGSDEFPEGTQALLDRLERLADMRDRGLLSPAEYDTAKAAVIGELEARS